MTSPEDDVSVSVSEPEVTDGEVGGSRRKIVDPDVLRGWTEERDPDLRRRHQLPALAELNQLDDGNNVVARYPIHGPEVLLGRYQSRYAPVDVQFSRLADHQTYRLGAPHALLECDEGVWHLNVVSPRVETRVDGMTLEHLHDPKVIDDGTEVTLGVTRFRFRTGDVTVASWRQMRQRLFERVDEPTLFLKRRGGVCGPSHRLDEDRQLVVGRSHPAPGDLPNTDEWPEVAEARWDLSGLYEFERKYVAFRHLVVELHQGRWMARALSSRQSTFINRVPVSSGRVPLETGDEIALGSVLLRFHHPHRTLESSRPRHVPNVVDWSEGRPPMKMSRKKASDGPEDN